MIVVDASVAVKWFVPEFEGDLALSILGSGQRLVAPELLVSETLHVLRKKIRSGDLTQQQFLQAATELPRNFDDLVSVGSVVEEASRLSLKLDHGFYDCVYLALAVTSGSELVTADGVFARKIEQAGFLGVVRRLSDHSKISSIEPNVRPETIESIARLAGLVHETIRSLQDHHTGGELRFLTTSVFEPVFSSPAYLRLEQIVLSLKPEERVEVIALGWLGRTGETGSQFPALLENARRFMDDPSRDIAYIVSVMWTVQAGYKKLLALRGISVLDEDDR